MARQPHRRRFKPPVQLKRLQFQGCCSVTDPDLCPLWVAQGLEYHVDIKGQGESFEQLVIFHQPDLCLMCLNSCHGQGCS